jgi:uncharacterized protein (UPF0254 family)
MTDNLDIITYLDKTDSTNTDVAESKEVIEDLKPARIPFVYILTGLTILLSLAVFNQAMNYSKMTSEVNDLKQELKSLKAINSNTLQEPATFRVSENTPANYKSNTPQNVVTEDVSNVQKLYMPSITTSSSILDKTARPETVSQYAYTGYTSNNSTIAAKKLEERLLEIIQQDISIDNIDKTTKYKIIDLLNNIDSEQLSDKDAENLSRVLTFIQNTRPLNTRKYKPGKVSINYPDPSLLDSDPLGYTMKHLDETRNIYGSVIANLQAVEYRLKQSQQVNSH